MSSFLVSTGSSTESEIIIRLFNDGYTNKEIRSSLDEVYGINISERTLKRRLSSLDLQRNKRYDPDDALQALKLELQGSGCSLGYRSMSKRLLNRYNIRIPRSVVAEILRELDPEGVEQRMNGVLRRRLYSAKGPNYIVHIDGHDKLKQFGFAIHGAIDGFSRRILWMKVGKTNNDPHVVASHFLNFILEIGGTPRCLRVDAGTENVLMNDVQRALRDGHADDMAGQRSVLIGSSPSNQRIERWWRTLRQSVGQFWQNLFKDMVDIDLLSTAVNGHIETLKYCFFHLIEKDVNDFVLEWNTHSIRKQRQAEISGKPDLLYFTPGAYETRDYKFSVDRDDILEIQRMCNLPDVIGACDADISALYDDLLDNNNISKPETVEDALYTYQWIVNQF